MSIEHFVLPYNKIINFSGEDNMKYRFKLMRESELLTQKQVADRLFCSQRTYCYYETEEHDIPTQMLIRLADLYNVSVDYLLCRTDNPNINK